jgi:hypothetical protein
LSESGQKLPDQRKERRNDALQSVIAEVLFVLLPMIVIGTVLAVRGEIQRFIYIPEWSLVNAVIVGQSVMKMFSGVLRFDTRQPGNLLLTVAGAIVLLLVPTLVVLSFILVSDHVAPFLAVVQLVLFACGIALHSYVLYQLQAAGAE